MGLLASIVSGFFLVVFGILAVGFVFGVLCSLVLK